jgi:hypothetical protein
MKIIRNIWYRKEKKTPCFIVAIFLLLTAHLGIWDGSQTQERKWTLQRIMANETTELASGA